MRVNTGRVLALRQELSEQGPGGRSFIVDEDGTRMQVDRMLSTSFQVFYYQLPFWEELAEFIAPATQLLLLYVLAERSLKRALLSLRPHHQRRSSRQP